MNEDSLSAGFNASVLEQQVSYYNNDMGCDVCETSPIRAVCANVAWCLVDSRRFFEYYDKSEFWATELHSALRQFGQKTSLLPRRIIGDRKFRAFRRMIRDYLVKEIGLPFIVRPHKLNIEFDTDTVYVMLVQAFEESKSADKS